MSCHVCGAIAASAGQVVQLCFEHEQEWYASPERLEASRARRRFADRAAGRDPGPEPKPEGAALTIAEAQEMVGAWADRVFPDRTVHTTLAKLVLEEVPEFLLGGARDPGEYADLVILILDVAHQRGIDVGAAVREKHRRNEGRRWVRGESGVYRHDPGEEEVGVPHA